MAKTLAPGEELRGDEALRLLGPDLRRMVDDAQEKIKKIFGEEAGLMVSGAPVDDYGPFDVFLEIDASVNDDASWDKLIDLYTVLPEVGINEPCLHAVFSPRAQTSS